jgi:hypothetical protein
MLVMAVVGCAQALRGSENVPAVERPSASIAPPAEPTSDVPLTEYTRYTSAYAGEACNPLKEVCPE